LLRLVILFDVFVDLVGGREMKAAVHIRLIAVLMALTYVRAEEDHEYTNDFAVEIEGDMTVADLVAGAHSLRVVRHVCVCIVVSFFLRCC